MRQRGTQRGHLTVIKLCDDEEGDDWILNKMGNAKCQMEI